MLHDGQLEVDEIVGVHPVLRRLTDEGTLAASRTGITLDWVTTRAYEII